MCLTISLLERNLQCKEEWTFPKLKKTACLKLLTAKEYTLEGHARVNREEQIYLFPIKVPLSSVTDRTEGSGTL